MLLVDKVKESRRLKAKKTNSFGLDLLYQKRSIIPAVTHVDLSARIQTVHSETNKFFHELLVAFKKKTKCPIL